MNAAKFTLTSTILAAALGLALGLAPAPALAGPPDEQGCHRDHKVEDCPVSGDVTIFDVILESLVVTGTGSSAILCSGTTDILANPGLSVDFDDCTVDMSVNIPGIPVFDMSLFRLEVKTKGSGVREAVLNFRDDEFIAPDSNLWVTDRLSVMVTMPVDGVFSLIITETLPLDGFILTKGHQPHKGAMTTQGLLIGRFIYSPIVPDG